MASFTICSGYMQWSLGKIAFHHHTGSCLSQEDPTLNVVVAGSTVKGSETKLILHCKAGTCQNELSLLFSHSLRGQHS